MRKTGHRGFDEPTIASSVAVTIEAPTSTHNHWKERALFLTNFLKNPLRNASVIPSSKSASEAILFGLNWDKINTVVELGPGSGTFTAEILSRCKPGTNVVLIELEESYVDLLRNKFGSKVKVVCDSAQRMNHILHEMNLSKTELIVSSLPFLQKRISQEIFAAVLEQTHKGAAFRFFTYMPPVMKWFYRGMPLHKVKFVLKNIPPMWIYGIN